LADISLSVNHVKRLVSPFLQNLFFYFFILKGVVAAVRQLYCPLVAPLTKEEKYTVWLGNTGEEGVTF
jgi:hypothetical protein